MLLVNRLGANLLNLLRKNTKNLSISAKNLRSLLYIKKYFQDAHVLKYIFDYRKVYRKTRCSATKNLF